MSRRLGTLLVGAALLLTLGGLGALLPVPYVALTPGPTYDTLGDGPSGNPIITVTGTETNDTSGLLSLTTVAVYDHIDFFTAIRGWFDDEVAIVPREEIYPPDRTDEEVDEANRADFLNSQQSAEQAALEELGYPVKVVVQELSADSPSRGRLRAADAIESIDGTPTPDLEALSEVLTGIDPGTTVDVVRTRLGEESTVRVTTGEAADRAGSVLGVVVSDARSAPFDVEIRVDEVGGPSAGLMLALGILDLIGDVDLTGGDQIAGTGTIDNEGAVGPIGGIRLKMIAADDLDAAVFLVPAGNCAEALLQVPEGLVLARVATLDDALDALDDVRDGGAPPSC
ncbi:MAG: PDZ domain-containing protein [Actinomycetota bacterium]|nr:PDZ domain-containing protein [Geodermatophilaceae bacterium]MDQ3504691.1 PDZ domain-containing protein [Actinomycetota bacterium]